MKSFCLLALSLGVLTSLAAGPACAQYQMPGTRPTVSPWLNLLRSGASPSDNYYNLVRPQFDFGSGINTLQSQTAANRSAIGSLEGGVAGQYVTGHRSGFMTQGRYFMNNNAGAANARGGSYGGGGLGRNPGSGFQTPLQGGQSGSVSQLLQR